MWNFSSPSFSGHAILMTIHGGRSACSLTYSSECRQDGRIVPYRLRQELPL